MQVGLCVSAVYRLVFEYFCLLNFGSFSMKKMEKERLEKQKLKAEKEKAEKDKAAEKVKDDYRFSVTTLKSYKYCFSFV